MFRSAQPASRFAAARRQRWVLLGLSAVMVVATCATIRTFWAPEDANAQAPQTAPTAKAGARPAAAGTATASAPAVPPAKKFPDVVALVNNEQITRAEVGKSCLKRHGKEVLESMINKHLILQECQKRKITVTEQEVVEEIDKLSKRFGLARDQWLKMLSEERDISPQQYANDIIWPTLALRKLAADRLVPTPEEIQQAYEMEFGPAVQARLIVCESVDAAQKVYQLAKASPENFPKLAIEHSQDYGSASTGGLVQPIRHHMGDKKIEEAAFALEAGQISQPIPVANQFVIIKCEKKLDPRPVKFEMVQNQLVDAIRERKLRKASGDVFKAMQDESRIENVLNHPQLRQKFPGVAAYINDQRITIEEVTEECLERHGKKCLEALIAHRVVEQKLREQKLAVSDADIQGELAEAAKSFEVLDPKTGKPDVKAFLEKIETEQDVPADQYIEQVVWPAVALRKLVEQHVSVTDDDLKRGFDSNFGPRVRCRAIVCSNHRRATEVWEMARRKPTVDNFAQLAEKYSEDPSTRALRGEIPPIARYSGRELLEKEAFRLQPGELSSVIQVDDKWAILFCEGLTEPVAVKFEEVAESIRQDVYEKKLQLAMSVKFTEMKEAAGIDNFLTGTSQAAKAAGVAGPAARKAVPATANKPGTTRTK